MKKVLWWCLPLLIVAITFGIVILSINANKQQSTIYASKFSYKYVDKTLELTLNDAIVFNKTEFNIEPSNCTEKIVFTSDDDKILKIDNNTNKIVAKQIGTCTLFAYIKSGMTEYLPPAKITVVVTNENSNVNKENETHNFTYELSKINNSKVIIEFNAGKTKDENSVNITNGNECIEIINENFNTLTILLKNTGNATIEIDSPLKKVIINITIT